MGDFHTQRTRRERGTVEINMSYYKQIKGVKYDRSLLEQADELTSGKGDGRISKDDANQLWEGALDGKGVTACEHRTLHHILENYQFTEVARKELQGHLGDEPSPDEPSSAPKASPRASPKPKASPKASPRALPKASPKALPKASAKASSKASPRISPRLRAQRDAPKAAPPVPFSMPGRKKANAADADSEDDTDDDEEDEEDQAADQAAADSGSSSEESDDDDDDDADVGDMVKAAAAAMKAALKQATVASTMKQLPKMDSQLKLLAKNQPSSVEEICGDAVDHLDKVAGTNAGKRRGAGHKRRGDAGSGWYNMPEC